ncbi:toll/interleukin-1 receptor domain-containing adapter protein-like [Engraulis encrasicolus]|uniref:toll/interleukin-1 receptor domain-containing adapter protein-like n=1 Tax=Engraulis encrasicolus TaxID=184585 RepID=UPI002FD5ACC1
MTAAIMFSWRRRKGRPNDSSVSASSTSRCSSSTTSSGTPSSGVPSDGCSCVSQTDCLCPGGAASPGGSGSPSGRTMCASSSSDVLSCASSTASLPACLTSAFRWSLDYDLCVCHSVQDHSEALRMVTYLEAKVRNLRCYLLPRDCPLGGAVSTELYSAVHSSHCWVLLISSHFLQDEWCLYQMQQALMEGPMAGRIIPTKLHLPFSECPKELCFYFIIDLGQDTCHGYDKVYKAVLQYLKSGLEKDESKSIVSTSHPNKGKFSSLNGTLDSHPRSTTMQQQSTDTSSEKGNIMN